MAGEWGDKVKHWRDMRRLERALAAVQKLRAKGLSPKAVDPSILFPLLDAASLIDNDGLKDKWDTLLANAADPTCDTAISPSLVDILRQLTPLEAQILDDMYNSGREVNYGDSTSIAASSRVEEWQAKYLLSRHGSEVIGANLYRLGLVDTGSYTSLGHVDETREWSSRSYHLFSLTPLAVDLVRACS